MSPNQPQRTIVLTGSHSTLRWIAATVATTCLLYGCKNNAQRLEDDIALAGGRPSNYSDEWVGDVGKAFDDVGYDIAKYGTVSMSSPLLALPQDMSETAFRLENMGPADYFKDAKEAVQGSAGRLDRQSRVSSLGVEVQADLSAQMAFLADLQAYGQELAAFQGKQARTDAAAQSEAQAILAAVPPDAPEDVKADARRRANEVLAQKLSGPTTRPSYPEMPTPSTQPVEGIAPAVPDLKTLIAAEMFSEAGALLPTSRPTLSNRAALHIAAGDTATEAIYTLLGNPAKAMQFHDKLLLIGVSMVSVAPGWKTQEQYAADVSLRVKYQYRPARPGTLSRAIEASAEVLKSDSVDESTRERNRVLHDLLLRAQTGGVAGGANAASQRAGQAGPTGADAGERASQSGVVRVFGNVGRLGSEGPETMTFKPQGLSGATGGYTSTSGSLSTEGIDTRFALPKEVPSPLVAAVAPMSEAEVLDLADSQRRLQAFALRAAFALRYIGLGAQAEAFDNYVRQIEQDVVTRTARPAVSTYSHSGGLFGFQIGPRLQALDAARLRDAKQNGPVDRLERQSFPVLIYIGMDLDDLGVRFALDGDRLVALEPVLWFEQSSRWEPLYGHRGAFNFDQPDRYQESERLANMRDLQAAFDAVPSDHEAWQAESDRLLQAWTTLRNHRDKATTSDESLLVALSVARDVLWRRAGLSQKKREDLLEKALFYQEKARWIDPSTLRAAELRVRGAEGEMQAARAVSAAPGPGRAVAQYLYRAAEARLKEARADLKGVQANRSSAREDLVKQIEEPLKYITQDLADVLERKVTGGMLRAYAMHRLERLMFMTGASFNEQYLPADAVFGKQKPDEPVPSITPHTGVIEATAGEPTVFLLAGHDTVKVTAVTIGGTPVSHHPLGKNTVAVVVDQGSATAFQTRALNVPLPLEVTIGTKPAVVVAIVRFKPKPAIPPAHPEAELYIERGWGGFGPVKAVTIKRGLSIPQFAELLRLVMDANSPGAAKMQSGGNAVNVQIQDVGDKK